VARWGVATTYVYATLPTDAARGTRLGELADGVKVDALDLQVGWNVYPNEADGKLWYQIRYKEGGQDRTGWIPASALALAGR
jgi:hypothetical protein